MNELANLSMPALHSLQHLIEDLIAGCLGTVSITLYPEENRKFKITAKSSLVCPNSIHMLFIKVKKKNKVLTEIEMNIKSNLRIYNLTQI